MTFPSGVTGKNWMSALDDRKSISDLSIPGTHDSGATWGEFDLQDLVGTMLRNLIPTPLKEAAKVEFIGLPFRLAVNSAEIAVQNTIGELPSRVNFAKDQEATIAEQLEMGVRMLDLRFRNVNGILYVYHGQSPQGQTADQALSTISNFLRQNPTETVLIHTQKASSEIEKSITTPNQFRNIVNDGISSLNNIITLGLYSGEIIPSIPAHIEVNDLIVPGYHQAQALNLCISRKEEQVSTYPMHPMKIIITKTL